MINEESLLKQLQNGLDPMVKNQLLTQYKNERQEFGFEKGYQDCMKFIKTTNMKLRQNIEKEKNRLIDQLRDEIWQRKKDIEKHKHESHLQS